MFKGIIFDLDGTTLNTLSDLTKAINKVMNDYHLKNYNEEEIRQKVGWGFRQLIINVMPNNTDEKIIDEALGLFTKYYASNYYVTTKPYKGMVELIDTLLKEGIKVGINSNKKHEYTKKLVEINYPNIDQELVYGKRDGYNSKPDPINNIEIIKKMNLENKDILYVGDSAIDYKTALNSNMKCCLVLWGFRSEEELKDYHADYKVNKPEEIYKIVKGH